MTISRRNALLTLSVSPLAASLTLSAQAQESAGVPLAASGAAEDGLPTQVWAAEQRLKWPGFAVERVTFESQGVQVVGNLFVPEGKSGLPAVVVLGPVGFVKEQSPLQYASRLVREGYVTLIFDPRFHGESGGEPRRFESGAEKTSDLSAAIDFLAARPEVDAQRISLLGICQAVNWVVEAALVDPRVKSVALVAGHYLTPELAEMYLGGPANVEARMAKSKAAEIRFRETGNADYIHIVSPSLDQPDPDALLRAPHIQMFYIRWADRNPDLAHRGLWENRLTAMSEHLIWGHRVDLALPGVQTPTLMIHAQNAASGPELPQLLFDTIPAARKKFVSLGEQSQLQFYEDPITIDQAIPHIAEFFA